MFSLIWMLFYTTTLITWVGSTVHVLMCYFDSDFDVKPFFPLTDKPEPRFIGYLKTWAYAPTLLAMFAWDSFKTSPKGGAWLKWMKEKV